MRISIDTRARTLSTDEEGPGTVDLYSDEAFAVLSRLWLQVGWELRYSYNFSWMGRPVIQLPEDLVRIQEVLYRVQPDVLVETGVAHGGSLVFSASVCAAIGRGRVIGIDVDIRAHNRSALDAHPLRDRIELIEGDSTDSRVVDRAREHVRGAECVLVLLDSNHSKAHVLRELEAYAPLVTQGSYIVAMDGIMRDLVGAPRSDPSWSWDNPLSAVDEFLEQHPEYREEEPAWLFNEGRVRSRVTYWPRAFLRRV